MSRRAGKIGALSGLNYVDPSAENLTEFYHKTVEQGMHGICFSPYEEGQEPGDQLTEDQIHRRMKIIAPYTKWVRSFSCTEGNELIPKVAKEYGIRTLVGAWLGDDPKTNQQEIEGLITAVHAGHVDIAAVGNEVLYRDDLPEDQLLKHLAEVKEAVGGKVPVGYVDAYYEFRDRPHLADACDVILANCYPFWEGCPLDYSLVYMKDMYQQAARAGKGKRVIITETGWPSQGSNTKGAQPSEENFMTYFINAQKWAEEEGIELFYFSSFDESWKVGDEGDVGAFWGIWDKNGQRKF